MNNNPTDHICTKYNLLKEVLRLEVELKSMHSAGKSDVSKSHHKKVIMDKVIESGKFYHESRYPEILRYHPARDLIDWKNDDDLVNAISTL